MRSSCLLFLCFLVFVLFVWDVDDELDSDVFSRDSNVYDVGAYPIMRIAQGRVLQRPETLVQIDETILEGIQKQQTYNLHDFGIRMREAGNRDCCLGLYCCGSPDLCLESACADRCPDLCSDFTFVPTAAYERRFKDWKIDENQTASRTFVVNRMEPDDVDLREPVVASPDPLAASVHNETVVEPELPEDENVQMALVDDMITPPDTDQWQVIEDMTSYVFSAHRDPRNTGRPTVNIFGVIAARYLRKPDSSKLYCHLVSKVMGTVDTVLSSVRRVGLRGYRFENLIIQCRFDPGSYVTSETFVSVAPNAWATPRNALRIHDNHNLTLRFQFALCGIEILHNFTEYHRFIEWMELNKLLGIQRTYVYVTTADDMMATIFDHYKASGSLVVLNVTGVIRDIWRYSTFGMMQDCLHRNMHTARYLSFTNIDENIVPRQRNVWSLDEMIINSKCANRTYISALNYFFDPDWPNDELYATNRLVVNKLKLASLLKTKRETMFLGFENRSRSFVRPEYIDHVKAYTVRTLPTVDEYPCIIHPDIGALHHYDSPSSKTNTRAPGSSYGLTLDRSLHKYESRLIKNTLRTHLKVGL